MTLMLDSEPTLEALAADTQSIHAWSQEDAATEPVVYRPRSWKLPVAAALAVAGAVTGGAFMLWNPQESAPKPQVAPTVIAPTIKPSPPVKAVSPDDRFVALLNQRGVTVVSKPMAIKAGHWVCEKEKAGFADPIIAQALVESTPDTNLAKMTVFVDTAHEVYCQ